MSTVKTMIDSTSYGKFTFDAVFSTSHSILAVVTEHPIESGASVADHAYTQSPEITMQIGITDASTDTSTIAGSALDRSTVAYQRMLMLMDLYEPFNLITRLYTYENMIITSISVEDDYSTQNALKATIIMKHIEIVSVSTVTVQNANSSSKSSGSSSSKKSSSSSKSSSTSSSSSSTTTTKKSVLKKLADKLSG